MSYVFEPMSVVGLPVHGSDDLYPVRRVYCVGRNYAAHAREMGFDPDREPPFFFCKPNDAESIVPVKADASVDLPYPSLTENYHYEIRRLSAVLLMAATSAALVSCASTEAPATVNAGANRAAVYPDITAIVSAETQQMSDQEAADYSARLSALASRRKSGTISDAEYRRQLAELQALRDNHGKATLSEIEGAK